MESMSDPKIARPDQPISDVIARRWSPYAFANKPVSKEDLAALFEAARWAPSSFNEQPWRYILGTKEDPGEFERVLSCLLEGNQKWAQRASALALGVVSRRFERNNKPNPSAEHDLGLAAGNLLQEATERGIYVHQMSGIIPDRAKEIFSIPEDFDVLTALAVGYLDNSTDALEELRKRDQSPRKRRPMEEFVFSGTWGAASKHLKP